MHSDVHPGVRDPYHVAFPVSLGKGLGRLIRTSELKLDGERVVLLCWRSAGEFGVITDFRNDELMVTCEQGSLCKVSRT